MALPMFSPAAGANAAVMDQQNIQMNQLAMQKDMLSIQAAQLSLTQQTQLVNAMKDIDFKGLKPDEILSKIAMTEMTINPEAAADLLAKAATIQHVREQAAVEEQKIHWQNLQEAERMLSQANDQKSWDAAVKVLAAGGENDPRIAQLLHTPYSPHVVAALRDAVTTAKDRAAIDANEARTRESNHRSKLDDATVDLRKSQKRHLDDLHANRNKAGAKGLEPKPAMVKSISEMIEQKYSGISKEDMDLEAKRIGEEAMQIKKKKPDLSDLDAATEAFKKADSEHRITGARPRHHRPGSDSSAPMPIPANAKASDLIPNMWYTIQKGEFKGQAGLWDAKAQKFIPKAWLDTAQEEEENSDDDDSDDGDE